MPTKFPDNQHMNDIDRQSLNNIRGMGNGFNPLADENAIIFKGNLCKKNWYGNKQLRFFELYRYGELKYYKDMKDYKGSITLGPDSRVLKMNRTTIKVFCEKKQKDYILVQPDSGQVNFAEEKKKNYCSFIDEWLKELNTAAEYLKLKNIALKTQKSKAESLDSDGKKGMSSDESL